MIKETWNDKAQARSKTRLEYFKSYQEAKKAGTFKRALTIGERGERIGKAFLTSGVLKRLRSYDLKWANMRVEIKCSKRYENNSWQFTLGPLQYKSDYLFCVCLANSGAVARIYFIPTREIKVKSSLKMGKTNQIKYGQYQVI